MRVISCGMSSWLWDDGALLAKRKESKGEVWQQQTQEVRPVESGSRCKYGVILVDDYMCAGCVLPLRANWMHVQSLRGGPPWCRMEKGGQSSL
jgi:hypothetical protein